MEFNSGFKGLSNDFVNFLLTTNTKAKSSVTYK